MSTVADFHLHGFDISHYQPQAPDFTADGRVFGIVKATEGVGVLDPHFAANRSHAHAQRLAAIGMYHFARPASHSAEAEAAHFLAVVGDHAPGEFAVLDYEVDPWSEGWAAAWIHAVKAAGWPVVFYTYRAMLAAHPHGVIKSTGAALWCAAYSSTPPATGDWPWTFWQHTDGQASVHGNDGPWDCSVFHSNDLNELRAFVGAGQENEMTNDEHDALMRVDARTKNLEAVAHRDIDTLAPMITEVLNAVKADPHTGTGEGDVTPADFIAALKAAL